LCGHRSGELAAEVKTIITGSPTAVAGCDQQMHYHSDFADFSRERCPSVPAMSHSGLENRKFCYAFFCTLAVI
jgi:hypothetical protein